jgi:glucose-6-phosphate dehydrogenase assembly protein OpcA
VATPVTHALLPQVLDDLGAVEAELARLWQAQAGSGDPREAQAVLRAVSFNLVALVGNERESAAAAAVLTQVVAEHPGRVLILWAEPGRLAARLRAWVSLHCRAIGRGQQVCAEQIVIQAEGAAVHRLPGVVEALLLPDCLSVLWWRAAPGPIDAVVDRLTSGLDGVLLDGTRFEPAELLAWARQAAGGDRTRPLGDLAWHRGRVWRTLTADAFEPQALRSVPHRLRHVEVAHGAGTEMVALLYLAWLAARLGWRPAPGLEPVPSGGFTGDLASATGPVAVRLEPGARGPGLLAVRLDASDPAVRVLLHRRGAADVVLEVLRDGAPVHTGLVRAPEPDEVALLGRWLQRLRPDPIYQDALAALGDLAARP